MTVTVDNPDRRDRDRVAAYMETFRSVKATGTHSPFLPVRSDSFAQGPQDEWDKKMKENYEAGGELKKRAEKALEDYRTGNTSPLP
jgi:hypothetical protein